MNKPTSCKYCKKRNECAKSYSRYIKNGAKHICLYEKTIKGSTRVSVLDWEVAESEVE